MYFEVTIHAADAVAMRCNRECCQHLSPVTHALRERHTHDRYGVEYTQDYAGICVGLSPSGTELAREDDSIGYFACDGTVYQVGSFVYRYCPSYCCCCSIVNLLWTKE